VQRIVGRVEELKQQDERLTKFLMNVKVQFRSGELSEDSFRAIDEAFNAMKARNAKEREEISEVLSMLGRGESGQVQLAVVPR
jgi:hypothetical protein